jgi:hypothetical protein
MLRYQQLRKATNQAILAQASLGIHLSQLRFDMDIRGETPRLASQFCRSCCGCTNQPFQECYTPAAGSDHLEMD